MLDRRMPNFAKSKWLFLAPAITRPRIWWSMVVAGTVDLAQFSLGPFGWLWVDQGLDVLAMLLIAPAIGFHPLLLPTFLIEFLPGIDMLPTWTACTAAVILLRKRNSAPASPPPASPGPASPPPDSPTIDISAEVTRVPPKL